MSTERALCVFLGKGVLKICSKFTGEHPCKSVISIKLLCYIFSDHLFIRTLMEGCLYEYIIFILNILNNFNLTISSLTIFIIQKYFITPVLK